MPRGHEALRAGLVTAVAFPVAAADECLGVIEFYSSDSREPNAEIAAMFASVGNQLAQYLSRRRTRTRRSLDGATALVVAIDARGCVEMANGTACAALGLSEGELLGRDWFAAAVPDEQRAGARAAFTRLLAGEHGDFLALEQPGALRRAPAARELALVARPRRRRPRRRRALLGRGPWPPRRPLTATRSWPSWPQLWHLATATSGSARGHVRRPGGRRRRLARTQTRRNPSGISSGRGRRQAVIGGRLAARCPRAGH